MPPSAIKSIRDLIYWQYAKLISKSAGFEENYKFIMNRFQKLKNEQILWSTGIKEYVKERERPDECIYCRRKIELTLDHLIPRARGGPDSPDNAVMICKSCNSSKCSKRLYEFYGIDSRDEIPRIAEGKYLKLLFDIHEQKCTLDIDKATLLELRKVCDLGSKCLSPNTLTVYCLEGLLTKLT